MGAVDAPTALSLLAFFLQGPTAALHFYGYGPPFALLCAALIAYEQMARRSRHLSAPEIAMVTSALVGIVLVVWL